MVAINKAENISVSIIRTKKSSFVGFSIVTVLLLCTVTLAVGIWLRAERQLPPFCCTCDKLKETSGTVRKGESTCCFNTESEYVQTMKHMLNKPEPKSKPVESHNPKALIADAVLTVLVVCIVLCLKTESFRENDNRHKDKDKDTESLNTDESSHEKSTKPLNQTLKCVTHGMLNSKPAWINKIRMILINNLDQIDVFVAHLATPEFNATAKWVQLKDNEIETRFFKFMDMWYEQTNHPSLEQIISLLQDINRNDIVNIIQNYVNLIKEENKYEEVNAILSPKPAWMNRIRMILINNLGQFYVFVSHLGTQEFNAIAQWEHLNDKTIETRFFKFMDLWYAHTYNPSLTQIISALQEMHRNDIIKTVQIDGKLKEQLIHEGIRNEDKGVPCDINYIDEEVHYILNSKPVWMNKIRKILINNLGQFYVFVAHLGTPEFNSSAKWEQLNGNTIETRFFKFMKMWYQNTKLPSLKQIISALQDINRNEIVNTIQSDVNLREQLIKEYLGSVPCGINCIDKRMLRKQATWYGMGALEDMNRNDLVYILQNDVTLGEKFIKEQFQNGYQCVPFNDEALQDKHRNDMVNMVQNNVKLKEQYNIIFGHVIETVEADSENVNDDNGKDPDWETSRNRKHDSSDQDSGDVNTENNHRDVIIPSVPVLNQTYGDQMDPSKESDKKTQAKTKNVHKRLQIERKSYKGDMEDDDGHDTHITHQFERTIGTRNCRELCVKRKGCTSFSDIDRQIIFDRFWNNLSWDQKKVYLVAVVDKVEIRQRKKADESRKTNYFRYHLKKNEQRIQVCRNMMLSTLGMKHKILYN